MAFVVVQHLDPDHDSLLVDLIKQFTKMPVTKVENGVTVQANCVYVIPPGRDMAFRGGKLQLLEPGAPRGLRLPIDFFFRSLAQDQRERAICIVLSGTGSDGTLGLKAIKEAGGMAMAQAPKSAGYDGMPRSAIATNLVDYVLPPEKMPKQLLAYVQHPGQASRRAWTLRQSARCLLGTEKQTGRKTVPENDQLQDDPSDLRMRADALWRKRSAERDSTSHAGADIPLEEALNLLHELEVHQIELEMQNDELRRTQDELAASRARYFDLYDLAPVGYLTLSEEGRILEANLTAANLLGLERSQLANQPVTSFIVPEDQDIYYLHRKRLFATQQPQVCELRMLREAHPTVHDTKGPVHLPLPQKAAGVPAKRERKDGAGDPFWVRLQATVTQSGADAPVWRVTLSDITEQKQAEDALQHAHDELDLRVQERTAELEAANEALRRSRDQQQSLTRRLVDAQENERAAIARELHDGAGQTLTCMLLDLGALARQAADNPEVVAKVQALRETADGLMSDLHDLAANLHPAALNRLGLVLAVRQHIDSLQGIAGLRIVVEDIGLEGNPLPPEVRIAVYRVVQEAVNNAIRHARARNIGVLLHRQAARLLVTIEDDGSGFDAETPAQGRLGLLSMHERIEMLGGSLTIESSPGAGATVFVEVPV